MATVAAMGDNGDATPGTSAPDEQVHRPVLLHPLIDSLQPRPGQVVVDGTLGAGGVTAMLLERVSPGGRVIAVDRDPAAVERGRARFAGAADLVTVVHGNFADLEEIVAAAGVTGGVDAVTLDLGISSLQLDDPTRGFAFRFESPLDMRMDTASPTAVTAADIVNSWEQEDLAALIREYGGEKFAGRIARAIVHRRSTAALTTTGELRDLVAAAIPRHLWPKRIHPATRTFQALRIEVNEELRSLERGLQAAISILRPGGRLGVIAFHSLEDILVKNALHVSALNCVCPPQQPHCTCAHRALLSLPSRRAIKPDAAEIEANPRARSARLRIAVKL